MVKRPFVILLAGAATVVTLIRRRRSQGDAGVWREATSDTSR
jgi:hypothetical protein